MSKYETELNVMGYLTTAVHWRNTVILRMFSEMKPLPDTKVDWECAERRLNRAHMETGVLTTHRGMTEEAIACQLITPFENRKIAEERIRDIFGKDVLELVIACSCNFHEDVHRAGLHSDELDELTAKVAAAGSSAMAIRLAIEIVNVYYAFEYMFEGPTMGLMIEQARRWHDEAVKMNDDSLSGLIKLLESAMEV